MRQNWLKIYKKGNVYGIKHLKPEGEQSLIFEDSETLEEAIKKANKYIIDNKVEYDLEVYPK